MNAPHDTATAPTYDANARIRLRHSDEYLSLKAQRNRSYVLAALAFAVSALACVAVLRLTPLKTVVPVVVTVDSATGHVSKVETADPARLSANEAIRQTELYDFVIHRNTLDVSQRQRLSDLVRLHASAAVAASFDHEMAPHNPDNPYYALGEGARRTVRVTRISLLDERTAQVNYQTHVQRPGANAQVEYWIATIGFAFTGKALALGDRWENPLGFIVTSYRSDKQLSGTH